MDTQLLVPFGLASVKPSVTEQARSLTPRGYSPITYVLQTAADFSRQGRGARHHSGERRKETCEGDPCAAVRALKAAHANTVVHTIGFDVDVAARYQLKCIAKRTGGGYGCRQHGRVSRGTGGGSNRPDGASSIRAPSPGNLTIKRADLRVTRSGRRSGKQVGTSTRSPRPSGCRPASNNTFGTALWKSVVVESGKPTVLEPGRAGGAPRQPDRAPGAGHTKPGWSTARNPAPRATR